MSARKGHTECRENRKPLWKGKKIKVVSVVISVGSEPSGQRGECR